MGTVYINNGGTAKGIKYLNVEKMERLPNGSSMIKYGLTFKGKEHFDPEVEIIPSEHTMIIFDNTPEESSKK